MQFNLDRIKEVIQRDKCVVQLSDYEGVKVTYKTKVKFVCPCGNENTRDVKKMYDTGGYCKVCLLIKENEKKVKTCMERYGVANSSQCKEIADKWKKTNMERYGGENVSQGKSIKDKKKATMQERYGVDNPSNIPEVREKAQATNLERYGFIHASQNAELVEKQQNTMMERYGAKTPMLVDELKEKIRQTCNERYGGNSPWSSPIIWEKTRQTCMERFGAANPLQCPEIAERAFKAHWKRKTYTFPSGATTSVLGYEPFALDLLIAQGYDETELLTAQTQIPTFWYMDDYRVRKYYPDIYVPTENRIIEVKSTWTMEQGKDTIYLKRQACIDAGYEFELWLFDPKGNLAIDP